MPKPQKPQPTKPTGDIVRAGVATEFWKVIESYLANELAELSYAIIKKKYNDKDLSEAQIDALRSRLDFVEWYIKLPQTIIASADAKEPELPNYDPYPHE